MRAQDIVAHNIRKLRVKQGLSQEALAVDAEIDRTYVSRLERKMENPTVTVLERLAAALSVKILPHSRAGASPKADAGRLEAVAALGRWSLKSEIGSGVNGWVRYAALAATARDPAANDGLNRLAQS